MIREYLRVRPTSEQLQPGQIPDAIASLHKLTAASDDSNRTLSLRHPEPPTFEFLAISEGEGEPVEFYYGVDGHLETLETRLRTIYPKSFDIDRVTFDVVHRLLRPVEYSSEEFRQRVETGRLYHEPTVALAEAADGPVMLDSSTGLDGRDTGVELPSVAETTTETDGGTVPSPDPESDSWSFEEETGGEWETKTNWTSDLPAASTPTPDQDEPADEAEPVVVDVAPPTTIEDSAPTTRLDQPTFTDAGTILARPSLAETRPCGVRWCGKVDRRTDWMTTLTPLSEVLSEERGASDEGGHGRAPLAALIDHLTEASEPLAFQVLFQRKPDWSRRARRRSGDLLSGKDTLTQKLLSIESTPHRTSPSMRDREKDRESVTRLDLVRENTPKRTFAVNVRAIALPTSESAVDDLDSRLDTLCPALDRIDGPYYEIEGQRLRDGSSWSLSSSRATANPRAEFEHLRTRTLVTRRSRWLPNPTNRPDIRPDLVLNADELANLIVVPSATDMTVEGSRGTHAEQQSRNPLPLPHHDLMRRFHDPGQAVGLALDQNGDPESVATHVPPHLLPFHVGRFAKTGAGKTVALINDVLSLYESTDGPVFVIDSKGGNLPSNYMRAHAKAFGFDDLEENVLHFSIPDVLPGFSFFDLRPALADPMATTSRENVVQDTADHYEEIIKLVMGEERYEQAIVAPNLIKYLIKLMFDAEHGLENGRYRESVDYFGHSQLEHAVTQLYRAGPPQPDLHAAPQSSDSGITEKIARHLEADSMTFANIMGGISNRMDYITQDAHLRRIFDNTDPRFDFRDLLDEHKVVLFDLGGLRDDAAQVLTGVILTSLYDAVKDRDSEVLAAKPDDYVVNVVIDEAATVVASDVLNTLLERGREFRLSVELVTQFPQQMELKGSRAVYLNVLTNIGTRLVGNITVDDEIADALAHEDLDPTEFRNRISALPRGEWIVQLPGPTFGETGPTPFHVKALPIPPGHLEGADPLTDQDEERFQTILERIHEHTQATFGVPTSGAPPTASIPDALQALLNTTSDAVDDALATVVWHVQVQEDVREINGWVPVMAVDETLRAWFADSAVEVEPPDPAELTEIRRRSRLLELDVDIDSGETLVRLTDAGGEVAAPNTGDVQSAGGKAHDDALAAIQTALTRLGFRVSVVTQDGSDQPDATARHDDLEIPFNVEVETTTHTKPTKVLANLQKAQAMGHVPLFVVTGDDEEAGKTTARRIERILDEPVRRRGGDVTEFYNHDAAISFNGGAPTEGGVTAVRPTTGDSRRTIWTRQDGEYILTDALGTEHARLPDITTASKDRFPAVYSYDRATGEYTVHEAGETHHYGSKASFRDDWVKVKQPFVPEHELSVPDYARESYAIVILGGDDEAGRERVELAHLYERGETTPLSTLLESPPSLSAGPEDFVETDAPGRPLDEGSESATETSSGDDVVYEDEESFLQAFVDARLTTVDGNYLPVAEAYAAYSSAAAEHDIPVRNKSWFSKKLGEHIEIERARKRIDGTLTRCYVGIELVDPEEEP